MASAKYMRVAMQIRWLIDKTAGECTVTDMAELTGESTKYCHMVCMNKGWSSLHRKITKTGNNDIFFSSKHRNLDRYTLYANDADLDYIAGLQDA